MIDFQIMEALSLKVEYEDAENKRKAEIEAKRRDFTNTRNPANFEDLNQFR